MGVAQHQPVRLLSRGVLRLAGHDTLRFLQGLVTVDVHRLCADGSAPAARALYGAFLNRRGRIAHAAFLVAGNTPDEVLLDAPVAHISALQDHLVRHRLRARVDIDDVSAELAVLAAQTGTADPASSRIRAYPRLASEPLSPLPTHRQKTRARRRRSSNGAYSVLYRTDQTLRMNRSHCTLASTSLMRLSSIRDVIWVKSSLHAPISQVYSVNA